MPIWLRRYHIQKINQFFEEQEKERKKHEVNENPDKKIMTPNIKPSSTFNFKK